MLREETLWPELLAIGFFVIVPWVSITAALHHEYRATEAMAVEATANLAQALEESTRRTIGQIDYILLSARALRRLQGDQFDFQQWVKTQTFADRMTAQIATTDSNGEVAASTTPFTTRISIADRPHFQAQIDPNRDELFISRPVIGRVSGLETLQFSRKLLRQDGGFAGVIVLSLGSAELARYYEALRLGKGFVSIASADGYILARGPPIPGLTGTRITQATASAGFVNQSTGSVRLPANALRGEQIASFRRLPEYKLVVMVGFDTETVFEPYRSLRTNAVLSGVAITFAVAFIGFLWLRQKQRSLVSRRALTITLDTISQGILMVDGKGDVSVINPRVLNLLTHPDEASDAAMKVVATRAMELATAQGDGKHVIMEAGSADVAGSQPNGRFGAALRNGTTIEVQTHALSGGGFVQTYTDVTEQRRAHAQVVHLAHHDPLTGLSNRVDLMERMSAIVDHGAEPGEQTALVMVDLDGFKDVNDTLGHDAGDALLIEVGRRLKALLRAKDLVAGLGGDEFVLLLPGLHRQEDVVQLAERVLRRLADPFRIKGDPARVGASLGIAFHPQDGLDINTWLKHADMALYGAKNGGRGTYRCFDEQLSQAATETHRLERDLRQALDNQQLEVYFQPKFNCLSHEISGFEALARWRHPTDGFISPAVFIRIAEDCGLIGRLGAWALEEACRCAAGWAPRSPVAVNVSVMQLRDGGLKDTVAAVLRRHGLKPEHLEIEVTESVMADDDTTVLESLRAIKAMGVAIALDDFGTGYSSLSYLRRFPFDKIKIDRAFVQGQDDDPGVRVILEAILGMCNNLGLATTGEGIETQQQLDLLRDRGCTDAQGFLLGRPMPAAEVQAFIRSRLRAASGTSDGRQDELVA